jgi:tRNA dimethylallyltransferase
MLVYRDMDVGTAKPGPADRKRFGYLGTDLVAPNEAFSTGAYIRHVTDALSASRRAGGDLMVVGGTGLYIKCLVEGLASLPQADRALRSWAEGLLSKGGLKALQEEVRRADPATYEALPDKQNPRRLVRALEVLKQGGTRPRNHGRSGNTRLIGLYMALPLLYERIEKRVQAMFEAGLPDEMRMLREKYGELSGTAAQAIGYQEAGCLLDGTMSREEAIARAAVRTRQLAKRQMTWFSHQADVHWVEVTPDDAPATTAERVDALWRTHGSTSLCI